MTYSDEQIIAAVMTNRTNRAAVAELGMQERHFYKRLQDERLQAKLKAAREKVVDDALRKLQLGMSEAADVLYEIMNDPNANKQTRINAANAMLSSSMKLTDQVSILQRLEKLENAIN